MGRRRTKVQQAAAAAAAAGNSITTTTTSNATSDAAQLEQVLGVDFDQTIPDTFIKGFVNSPGAFIVPDPEVRAAAMDVVGKTYDAANCSEKFGLFDDWSAVLSSGFDINTQLWELINMRNEPVLKYSADVMKELSQLIDSVGDSDSDQSAESSDAESADGSEDQMVAPSSGEEDEISEGEYAAAEAGSALELSADPDVEESDESNPDEEEQNDDLDGEDEDEEDTDAKPSVVDDQFFSLAEMEEFADKAEEEEMRDRSILAGNYPKQPTDEDEGESSDDDESIDLFQDVGGLKDLDDEEGEDEDDDFDMGDDEDDKRADVMKYADFFKAPRGSKREAGKETSSSRTKRVKFDESAAGSDEGSESEFVSARGSSEDGTDSNSVRKSNLFDDDDDGDEENGSDAAEKSVFEKRQEKLQGLIGKLEDEAVSKKHWTMIGEVGSNLRPKNSLLNEDLDFDHMQKPVPVITQDATVTLEDVIKRRILNEEWDDVERKKDIQAKPFRPSGFIELNDKASKKSLAEEYEQEYMAQKAGDEFVAESDVKLAESHRNIDSQMRSLFTQLDALSHFHFAPKPATADIEIRTNAPALQMEEKLPISVTQADQLAPSEIYEKKHSGSGRTGDILGDTELSREERKRRRQRKKHQAKKQSAMKPDSVKTVAAPKAKVAA
ncbi:u3 small nucleolar ribonucleoprotein MPP10 [Coemansia sp. RSA 988]|nr:u3 small nucleolar ribonucleoprotein MPP10 [Coemansia sp. RSA 988]